MESSPVQPFHHLALALLLFVFSVSVSVTEQGLVPSIRTDAAALLSFKKMIQNDPQGVLSGWQINRNPCIWYGVSCTLGRVTHLDLTGCSLAGIISFNPLSSLDMLSALNLSLNSFTVNSTALLHLPYALQQLQLSYTGIEGPVPESLFSKNPNLVYANLSHNNLSELLPDDLLLNSDKVQALDLSYNNFTGSISGQIPVSFSPCSWLQTLDLSNNNLTGPFPDSILQNLVSLERLLLSYNLISGSFPSSVSYCKSLKIVDLSSNRFSGTIPPNICPGATSLEELRLPDNLIIGEIPAQLSQCSKLKTLDFSINFLNGSIPAELGKLENLEQLIAWQLGAKALSGSLSGNTMVFVRNVGNSCKGVGGLLEFAGIKAERLLQVPTLKTCDFTRFYSGAVLSLFTQYQTLKYLDLSYNELRGKIPDEIGDMMALQVLELARNQLSGEIPASLGQLKNLGVFDASHNRLQGQIPDSFSNLSFLVQIDLSNNELTGEIPQRGQLSTLPANKYANNPGLCGVPLIPCESGNSHAASNPASDGGRGDRKTAAASWANSIVLGILISIASLCILIVWAIAVRVRHKEAEEVKMLNSLQASYAATTWKIDKEKEPLSINVATFQRQLRKLKFSQLIEATNGFSAASLIGCGGFGEVFKATLKDGSSVAIKKLIRLSCQGDREFMAEMETLGKINHRNLVPLLGYCKIGEERLLVYGFMEFGSLEEMLHGRGRARDRRMLTWDERKKITRGAAKGLCFLHHNCIPHIIHRDMKSSNVLLDHEMEARVSDFGMARLISALDTHLSVSTLAGTPGYVPPEYYQSFRCTAKGDVYSFGVVLLELITGKRPTDKDDFGDTNLVGWVKMKVGEGKQMEVIDPELLSVTKGTDESEAEEVKEMARFLEISLQCVDDFPSKRPNMLQVVAMLRELMPGSASG
ncbi:hypothetical protein DKX38_015534 [Salix brachista]|uniref:non-specific serine/threonine protein kinase n=1 Tax=Salix brachista TaxID=2182728 RepID=A0A5N5L7F1_9ROSI|nr:hypothetical protein DKX38_015534 [Salix brachista]